MPRVDFDQAVLVGCMDAFGDPCVWQPAGTALRLPFTGVFEEYHVIVSASGMTEAVTDVRPVVGCRLAEFPDDGPQEEELIQTADGRWWFIDQIEPDGLGHLKLMLKVAP